MAAERRRAAGIRLRTTAAALAVVTVALLIGSAALVLLVRDSLADGLETTAESRLASAVAQVEASGPTAIGAGSEPRDPDPDPDDDNEPDDELVEVRTADGSVVATTQPGYQLPDDLAEQNDTVRIEADEPAYVIRSDGATHDGVRYEVTVAVSTEEVDDVTEALLTPLAVGVPVLALVVAATTWLLTGRALAPVERIRREVASITDDRLDRRVPEPGSADEIGRLADTMNEMLARLEHSRDVQRAFVSDASHELRSPIATLRQAAEVVTAHPDAFEPGEFTETVAEESLRMQRLVEQLFTLTRADEGRTGTIEDVDVDDVVLAEVSRVRRAGLAVEHHLSPQRVRGSSVAWSQMVRNLVDNAVRHAAERVDLTVSAEGDDVVVLVDDDGTGVPEVDRERIFDRFVRLDEARSRDAGGSGLGLAIVRDLARAQGGSVRVESSPIGGARFVLRVPRGDSA